MSECIPSSMPPGLLRQRLVWRPAASWVVLAAGLTATIIATFTALRLVRENEKARFDRRVEQVTEAITNRMLSYEQVLNSAQGLYAASVSVEHGEWAAFCEKLDLERLYPGLHALGYIARVPAAERENFIQAARRDANPGFSAWPKSALTNLYVVQHVEPLMTNAAALGYDIATDSARKQAADDAAASGQATLTRRIHLVQTTADEPSVLLLLPIYQNDAPASTPAERVKNLQGWVYAAFVMPYLMNRVVGKNLNDIDF